MATDRLSKSEYARHRKVSPAMVSYWAKTARLVMVEGKIDVEKTDALLNATTDTTRGRSPGRNGGAPKQEAAAPMITETPISRATASDREASAAIKQLRLGREAGRLVSREEFEHTTEEIFAGVRDGLMGLPIKLATVLAAETDERRVMDILRDAIEATLNQRADFEDALAERAGATRQ